MGQTGQSIYPKRFGSTGRYLLNEKTLTKIASQYIMDTQDKKPNNVLPGLLAGRFLKDYKHCVERCGDNFKLEVLEHLLGCLDLALAYMVTESAEDWKLYQDKERGFLKKHGQS